MKWMYKVALALCFLSNYSWAQSHEGALRDNVAQAQATVQYAEQVLQEAQESLYALREQRPVLAGNNGEVVASQLETYDLALQARENAVKIARDNLKQSKLELEQLKR